MTHEYHNGKFTITTDQNRMDIDKIHALLTTAYWSEGIPREILERSLRNSLSFGIFLGTEQMGIARVITDYTTYAYICDVFIEEKYRGQGLGKWLIQCITEYPDLQGLRRWSLFTRDAHGLYSQFGFTPLKHPENAMEIARPRMYVKNP